MIWKEYTKDVSLLTGDIVLLESGQIGYCDGYDFGKPAEGICSVPEAWSIDFTYQDKNCLKEDGTLVDYKDRFIDKIKMYLKMEIPKL